MSRLSQPSRTSVPQPRLSRARQRRSVAASAADGMRAVRASQRPSGAVASVVVPTRDRPADLGRLLGALARQRRAPFEVIVVDDGSEPAIAPRARRAGSRQPGARAGRRSGGRPQRPAAAARAPTCCSPTTTRSRAEPGSRRPATSSTPHRPGRRGSSRVAAVRSALRAQPRERLAEAYWTCNIAYRRAVFERLGGFLEDFPDPHCEDLDLASARRSGRDRVLGRMRIVHFPRPLPLRGWIRARGSRAARRCCSSATGALRPLRPHAGAAVPIASALYAWARQLRLQGPGCCGRRVRLARFAVVASLHHRRRDRERGGAAAVTAATVAGR